MSTITTTLSTRTDGRGKSEILLRFVAGRDHIFRLHSGIFIDPTRFQDGVINIPRSDGPEKRELLSQRATLESLQAYLMEEFAMADKSVVTTGWMQDAVNRFHHPERNEKARFFDLFQTFKESKDVSRGRRNRYEITERGLRHFEKIRGRAITVEGMDPSTLERFKNFITNEHMYARDPRWERVYRGEEKRTKARGKNTVVGYMDVIRTFYSWMRGLGITKADPFRTYRIGSEVYGTPWYLSLKELKAVRELDLENEPVLAVQRDIFVFQCMVGCRMGDLRSFTKEDVRNGVLSYLPEKTRTQHPKLVRVPLTDAAKEIMEKYADAAGDRLLPYTYDQAYNKAIKEVLRLAGIDRQIPVLDPVTGEERKEPAWKIASSHLARRTFVGNLYRQVKDPNLVASMSGHAEGSKAFARYRDIDDGMKKDLVKLLDSPEG